MIDLDEDEEAEGMKPSAYNVDVGSEGNDYEPIDSGDDVDNEGDSDFAFGPSDQAKNKPPPNSEGEVGRRVAAGGGREEHVESPA